MFFGEAVPFVFVDELLEEAPAVVMIWGWYFGLVLEGEFASEAQSGGSFVEG